MKKPTNEAYYNFQLGYDFYNKELFNNQLPDCLITYQRMAKTKGFFAPERFQSNDSSKEKIDELAMNPDYFINPSENVLSTLAHEMCHVWQKHYGKPGRRGYHNKQWGAQMMSIGLRPSHDGTESGKMTGNHMTHIIITGGKFDLVSNKLMPQFKIPYYDCWASKVENDNGPTVDPGDEKRRNERNAKRRSKTKYTCPDCGLNVWGKSDITTIICGVCKKELVSEDEPN